MRIYVTNNVIEKRGLAKGDPRGSLSPRQQKQPANDCKPPSMSIMRFWLEFWRTFFNWKVFVVIDKRVENSKIKGICQWRAFNAK